MPYLDVQVNGYTGRTCFASIDFVHGYWQLHLHTESNTACGIIKPQSVYASARVLPELANSDAHLLYYAIPAYYHL